VSESGQPDTGGHAIQTEGISKHFGAVRAIDELSMAIRPGVTTSVVGPNGSGKSTLVNVLSGVLPLDGGLIVVDGARLRVVRAHEISRRGLTRTFQEVRLFDQVSVLDNILLVLTERRLLPSLLERRNRELNRRARDVLESVGMWEKRDALAGELSYGQRKLIEVGRALAMGVQIYLFDEPFAGLFPQMVERVKAILRRMRAEGRTIVFISHNMEIVRELSDRIIVLESGTLLAEGQVEPVLASPEVIEAYLGD
jgi:branched-chain amino acid transport system ATP-binding protein